MNENIEYKNKIKAIERFFLNKNIGSFLFVVGNDEILRDDVLKKSSLFAKIKVDIFSFKNHFNQEFSIIQNIKNFIFDKNAEALVLVDIEFLISENEEFLSQLNYSREVLLSLKIPLLFWIKKETIPLFANQVADVYNQRVSSNIYFDDYFSPQKERALDGYLMEKYAKYNTNTENYQIRIKLLNKQLEQAKEDKVAKEKIANDIVMELLEVYLHIPNAENPIKNLLEEYNNFFDLKKPNYCYIVAKSHFYINELNKSESLYNLAIIELKKSLSSNLNKKLLIKVLHDQSVLHIKKLENFKSENLLNEASLLIDELIKNLKIEDKVELLHLKLSILNSLSNLEINKGNFKKAEYYLIISIENIKELLKIDSIFYLKSIITCYTNLGIVQYELNNKFASEYYFLEALKLVLNLEKLNPQLYLLEKTKILNNFGAVKMQDNDFKSALNHFKEALRISIELSKNEPQKYLLEKARLLLNMSYLYKNVNPNKEKSIFYCYESIKTIIIINNFENYKEIIFRLFSILNDWEINPKVYITQNFPNNPELLQMLEESKTIQNSK
jgi:hypothetical protein